MKEKHFSRSVFFYILALFIVPLVTSNVYEFQEIFSLCILLLPVNTIILGILAGLQIEDRWLMPVIPPALLAAVWNGGANITDSIDDDSFGCYVARRLLSAFCSRFGIEEPDFSSITLFLITAAILMAICIISMLISAAVTSCIQKKHDKPDN